MAATTSHFEPELVPSTTDDADDEGPILDGILGQQPDKKKEQAVSFLLRYEAMVRQQEAE